MTDMRIQNGGGDGRYMTVNPDFQGEVHSTQITESEFINAKHHENYIVYASPTPTAANDVFFYMQNTHPTHDLLLDWYRVWTESAPEAIDVTMGAAGTPGGTTTAVPVNSTVSSSNAAQGLFYSGNDITGLSGATLYDRLRISGDGKDVVDSFPGKVILPKSAIVCFSALNGAIPLEFTLSFHYKLRS